MTEDILTREEWADMQAGKYADGGARTHAQAEAEKEIKPRYGESPDSVAKRYDARVEEIWEDVYGEIHDECYAEFVEDEEGYRGYLKLMTEDAAKAAA